jgi:hypothetical protein
MNTKIQRAEARREASRKYRANHREKVLAQQKSYSASHKDFIAARKKAYYKDHSDVMKAQAAAREASNRASWQPLLDAIERWSACAICGNTEDLCLHHLDPTTKKFNLADGMGAHAFPDMEVLAELAICVTLCRLSCHLRLHAQIRRVKKAIDLDIFNAVCTS